MDFKEKNILRNELFSILEKANLTDLDKLEIIANLLFLIGWPKLNIQYNLKEFNWNTVASALISYKKEYTENISTAMVEQALILINWIESVKNNINSEEQNIVEQDILQEEIKNKIL